MCESSRLVSFPPFLRTSERLESMSLGDEGGALCHRGFSGPIRRSSREGQQIVFGMGGKGGKADIFVMNADGTGIRPVLQHAAWDSSVDWGSG